MAAVLSNLPANRLQRPPVFFLGHPIGQLAHVLHGQLAPSHPVHAPNDQSQLAILHRDQSAIGRFHAKASRHAHGEMLQFGHLWKPFHRGFENKATFEPDEGESASATRSPRFQV